MLAGEEVEKQLGSSNLLVSNNLQLIIFVTMSTVSQNLYADDTQLWVSVCFSMSWPA